MVTGFFQVAHPAVHACIAQGRGQHRIEQQVVDAQAAVARPVLAEIVPERVDAGIAMDLPQRVGPALGQQLGEGLSTLRLQQRVAAPALGIVGWAPRCNRRSAPLDAAAPPGSWHGAPVAPSTAACSRTSAPAADCRWARTGSRPRCRGSPLRCSGFGHRPGPRAAHAGSPPDPGRAPAGPPRSRHAGPARSRRSRPGRWLPEERPAGCI